MEHSFSPGPRISTFSLEIRYNEAYAGSEITAETKTKTVEELMEHLRKAGKHVNVSFWAV